MGILRLSVIIPTLNDNVHLPRLLKALAPARSGGTVRPQQANPAEIIIADGGSNDGTVEIARLPARVW